MEVIAFLLPWIVLGALVAFVAFAGGPRGARPRPSRGGRRALRLGLAALYIVCGVAIPALIIGARDEAVGGTGALAATEPTPELERGKDLFNANCKTCHTLRAAQAYGQTGPDLDALGAMNQERVLGAIENGGSGKMQMPAGLLEGENAKAVAAYVARVAGR